MIEDDRCIAVLRRGSEQVRCDLPARHGGSHSGRTTRSYVDWSTGETAREEVPAASPATSSDGEEDESYADVEVERCIYCNAREFETAFIFAQPPGLRVAVPGRVGLCRTCERLLREGHFDAVLERTRDTSFADFPDDAVLELIEASRASIPE